MPKKAPVVDLNGKVVIITGANTGIGYITARDLAKMGAHVILAGRTKEKLDQALNTLKQETQGKEVKAETMILDLSSFKSIREFVQNFKAKNLPLHILINNAGVMALPNRQVTVDGLEMQIGTNHFGHFLLTTLLLDVIKASAPARIVNLSSRGHNLGNIDFNNLQLETGYGSWYAYGNSKLANILFTNELQRRLEGTKVFTNSVHPGWVATELAKNMGGFAGWLAMNVAQKLFAKTPEQGAQTSIYVAVSPELEGVGGKYYADCAELSTSDRAQDVEAAKKLWEISEKVTAPKEESTMDPSKEEVDAE